MNLAAALQAYADTILGSVITFAPYVAVSLLLILLVYGVMRKA